MAASMVIKVTVGIRSSDRCLLAFKTATRAIQDDFSVSFWLAQDASFLAAPGRIPDVSSLASDGLPELLTLLIKNSTVTLCRGCAARRDIRTGLLLPGIRMAGAAVFVEECLEADLAVVF
jgi:predicted peroxiredoxin